MLWISCPCRFTLCQGIPKAILLLAYILRYGASFALIKGFLIIVSDDVLLKVISSFHLYVLL